MVAVKPMLSKLLADESGQDLIEYALLAALIATVSVLALNGLGRSVLTFYQNLTGQIPRV